MEAKLFYTRNEDDSQSGEYVSAKRSEAVTVNFLDSGGSITETKNYKLSNFEFDKYGVVSSFDLQIDELDPVNYEAIYTPSYSHKNSFGNHFNYYCDYKSFKTKTETGEGNIAKFDANFLKDAVDMDSMTGIFIDYTGLTQYKVDWKYEANRGPIPPWVKVADKDTSLYPIPIKGLSKLAEDFFYLDSDGVAYSTINLPKVPNFTQSEVSYEFIWGLAFKEELFQVYKVNYNYHVTRFPDIGLILNEILNYSKLIENNAIPLFKTLGIVDGNEDFYFFDEEITYLPIEDLYTWRSYLFLGARVLRDFVTKFDQDGAPSLTDDELLNICSHLHESFFRFIYPSIAIKIIDTFLNRYSSLVGTNIGRRDFREEEAIIKVLNGVADNVAVDAHVYCTDFLNELENTAKYYGTSDGSLALEMGSRFNVLYNEFNDFIGSENLKHFSIALFRIWEKSLYNPNSPYLKELLDGPFDTAYQFAYTKFNLEIDPEALSIANTEPYTIPVIEMKASNSIGFYFDDMTFKFTYDLYVQSYKEEIIETPNYGEYGGGSYTVSKSYKDPFHIYCPMFLKGVQANDLPFYAPHTLEDTGGGNQENVPVPIPMFFIKAIDDYGDTQDVWTAIDYTVDIVSIVVPFGYLSKLRYLKKVSLIRQFFAINNFVNRAGSPVLRIVIGLKKAEITSGVMNLLIKLAYGTDCGNYTSCQALKNVVQAIEVVSLGIDTVYGIAKLCKKIEDLHQVYDPATNSYIQNHKSTVGGVNYDDPISGSSIKPEIDQIPLVFVKSNFQDFLKSMGDFAAPNDFGHNFTNLASKLDMGILNDDAIKLVARVFLRSDLTDEMKAILNRVESELLNGNNDILHALELVLRKESTLAGDLNPDFMARLSRNLSMYNQANSSTINLKSMLIESEIAWMYYKRVTQNIDELLGAIDDMTDIDRAHFATLVNKYRFVHTRVRDSARGILFEDYIIKMFKDAATAGQGIISNPHYIAFKKEITRLYPEVDNLDDWDMLSRPMLGLDNVITPTGLKGHIKPDICFVRYNEALQPIAVLIWDVKLNKLTKPSKNQRLASNASMFTFQSTEIGVAGKGFQRIRGPRGKDSMELNLLDEALADAGNDKLEIPNKYDLFSVFDGDQDAIWSPIDLAGEIGSNPVPIIKGYKILSTK